MALATFATLLGGSLVYLRMNSDDLSRDLPVVYSLAKAKRESLNYASKQRYSIADYFMEAAKKWPSKTFLNYITEEGNSVLYTYQQVDEISNQVANLFSGKLNKGDVVALMMDNRPEFIFSVLGLAKIGVVAALININLTGVPLAHSLLTSNATSFIIGHEHVHAVNDVRTMIANDKDQKYASLKTGTYYSYGGPANNFVTLDPLIEKSPTKMLQPLPQSRSPNDTVLYIYTSGTTGLPKASIIAGTRFMGAGAAWSVIFKLNHNDTYYSALPLYHSSAMLLVVSSCIKMGMTFAFRRKFSAKKFWSDCKQSNATIVQYIGEICAYLLNSPPSPADTDHKVRLAIGNGLRGSIWEEFQTRFKIAQIGEFYASTEGNASLLNMLNKKGAVGFVPKLAAKALPIYIVKFDIETEQFIRDKNGMCILCGPGEVGQLVAEIVTNDVTRSFQGYTSKEATQKKIVSDVLKKGDTFFSTGDLLYKDEQGFFYFADRVGDTFRWKGENVATGEVEAVLRTFPGILDITVYGVQVPNTSGNAGMANIVVADASSFDTKKFWDFAKEKLPSYARPIFLRVGQEIQITATFKHQKAALRKEGYNPSLVKDPLFFSDHDRHTYVPLTKEVYDKLASGIIGAKL